uniref:Uncharacterized protein n=1 Tax=Anopheles farauti TaxID=69004 RepID=A0A182QV63_9DIPT
MCAMYREVPLFQQSVVSGKSKSITISSGGYNSMLVDSKTSEVSGGFRFTDSSENRPFSHRFIYWRTCQETIYLTEVCLDKNDVNYEMKIKFEGSPILAVECYKLPNQPLIMVFVTTTSFHRVSLQIPGSVDHLHAEQDAYIHQLHEKIMTDKLHCYSYINDIVQAYPLIASITHFSDNCCSKIAIACANSLHLFTMKTENQKLDVTFVELDYNPLTLSKLIHTITETWRKKPHTSQVVTMAFDAGALTELPQNSLLYTLHRDGALRVWLPCGRCLTTDYLSQYTQGSETEFHTCIIRCSRSLLALYFSFQTFSEFVILRPEVAVDSASENVSSVVLKNMCTVLAPNYDLIDFKLSDQCLWSLWCNAEGETRTLFYKLATGVSDDIVKTVWSPVILENTSGKDLSALEVGMDLKDIYCNRIIQSGLFTDKVITKTLTMFNRNLATISASSTVTKSSMVRLKRYVITCIESQLQQECPSSDDFLFGEWLSKNDLHVHIDEYTMFQSIEFNCHIELGHYEEAYNSLTKNCEPAPAVVAYEEGIRNFLECNSLNHLSRHYSCILKCLNSLGIIKESYAWIVQPMIEQAEQKNADINGETVKIVDRKNLVEQLITTHCALQLSMNNDGFKLITSLVPANLISLMLKCKLYNSALKLARCRVRSMIPTIYEHITSSCITASSAQSSLGTNANSNNVLSWLNDNCVSDVAIVSDSASTAWNYLRYLISQEDHEDVVVVHLAVLNRILSRCAYVPTWLKYWCIENIPVQFIRAYLCHGQLEEAYEHTIELFRSRFFSSGRFRQHTIFPITMCDYLLYELEHSSNHAKEKQHIEHYLRIIELAL